MDPKTTTAELAQPGNAQTRATRASHGAAPARGAGR